MSKRIPIIVLNDGETWCTLDGVELYLLTQQEIDLLNEGSITVPRIWRSPALSVNDLWRKHLGYTDKEEA
jgi:hypothetical protein